MTVSILSGDCLERLRDLDDDSIDAVVTDPPYGLSAQPDAAEVLTHWLAGDDYEHTGGGFMGKTWDSFVPGPTVWKECLRVLKPGGHLVAFFGTRTVDLGGIAIRLAGFEIRDCLAWHYGSGFPKSLDVSKAIDRRRYDLDEVYTVTGWIREARDAAGIGNREIDEAFGANGMGRHWTDVPPNGRQPAVPTLDQVGQLLDVLGVEPDDVPEEIRRLLYDLNGVAGEPGENWTKREVVGEVRQGRLAVAPGQGEDRSAVDLALTAPATESAQKWNGWGTALKPAFEPIILARKPLIGTVAENVTRYGTGALNVDGCRVAADYTAHELRPNAAHHNKTEGINIVQKGMSTAADVATQDLGYHNSQGRWPANLILDEEAGAMLDAQSGDSISRQGKPNRAGVPGEGWGIGTAVGSEYNDTGGASRFFYTAKASRGEREAGLAEREAGSYEFRRDGSLDGKPTALARNVHPTVKPIDLMRYLVRLVTPPGGTVLDPFTGSGTTGIAAGLEGFDFLGIEREADYREIAEARLRWWAKQDGDTAEILRRAGLAEKVVRAAKESGQSSLFEEEAA